MNEQPTHEPEDVGEQGFSAPSKTPLFEARQADRYARQRLIQEIQEKVGRHVICYVAGKRTKIDRDDVLGL